MKLIDAIRRVNRDPEQSFDPDIRELCEELHLQDNWGWNEDFNKRVRGYPLIKWICTDTWVGTTVYYLDDEPICVSTQTARKNDTYYYFVSKEAADKLRALILSLPHSSEEDKITLIDEDEEVGEDYTLSFTGQLLTDKGFVDGKPCKVVNKFRENFISQKVEVEFEDGTRKVLNIGDFHIPLNVVPE